jgi:hypothetical protein
MAKYLQRSCPKCDGYLGIVVPERKMPMQAINRWSFEMCLRLAWFVVLGNVSILQDLFETSYNPIGV